MSETNRLLTRGSLTNEDRQYFSLLERQLQLNDISFCCRQFTLVNKVISCRKQTITSYIAEIYTLGEDRWASKMTIPYDGSDVSRSERLRDIWKDYPFDLPQKTCHPHGTSLTKDLRETRWREPCSKCSSSNQSNICDHCRNTSFVLTWYQITARWTNEHSRIVDLSSESCLIPEEKLSRAAGSISCLEFDGIWSAETKSLDSILDTCSDVPEPIRQKINDTFVTNHYQLPKPIRRLSLMIRRVNITQIQYQLRNFPGRTFVFCVYGTNNQLYIPDDLTLSTSQQLMTRCSLF